MKHQRVVQFDGQYLKDYDRLIALEDRLIDELPEEDGEVDGHDMGSGQMNIFVLTDCPQRAFAHILRLLEAEGVSEAARVAYRAFAAGSYIVLWPAGLEGFDVV